MIDNCQTIIVRHLKCCHSGWRGYGCRLYSWLLHKCFCKLLHTKLKQLECTISAFLPIFFKHHIHNTLYVQYKLTSACINAMVRKNLLYVLAKINRFQIRIFYRNVSISKFLFILNSRLTYNLVCQANFVYFNLKFRI